VAGCPLRRVRLARQPGQPGREAGRRVHLVGLVQSEAVLMLTRTPLGMGLEPGGVQPGGRRDQLRHVVTIPSRSHTETSGEQGSLPKAVVGIWAGV
jgi:hypothetical protein